MRLTRKGKLTNYRCDYPNHTTTDCIKKLGQLEDIEEELGIDLITLYKVMSADKVYNKQYGYYDMCSIDIQEKNIWFDNVEVKKGKPMDVLKLKEYKKTWALTREEITENDK